MRYKESGEHAQAPVVVAGDDHWSGIRPDRISALVNHAAAAYPARPPRRPSTRQGATHVHADHRRPRPRRKHAARHPRNRAVRLDTYLVLSDYYHRPTQLNGTHTAFELLSVADVRPRIVGVATIEPYSELDARRDLKAVFAASPVHARAS